VNLEIAQAVAQRRLSPKTGFKPSQKCVEASDDIIKGDFNSAPDSRIWDLSPIRSGAAKDGFYDVHPRKHHRGIHLISDALPFGRLWYIGPNAIENAIGYAKFNSRSHDAVIRVYDDAGPFLSSF
jgi:hypothetical protein